MTSKYAAARKSAASNLKDEQDTADDTVVDHLLALQRSARKGKVPSAFMKTVSAVLAAGVEAVKSGEQPDIDNLPLVGSDPTAGTLAPVQSGHGVQLSQQERKVITDLRAGVYQLDQAGRIKHPVSDPDQAILDEVGTKLDEAIQALGINMASSDWKHKVDTIKDWATENGPLLTTILQDLGQVTGKVRAHGETAKDYWTRIKDELTNLNGFKQLVVQIDAKLHDLTGEERGEREPYQDYIMRTLDILANQRGRRGRR